MKFQVTQSFSVTIKGRRTEYKVGQRIGEAAYRRLTKTQQGRFLPARKCGAQSWTDQEYRAIAEAYILFGRSEFKCLDYFRNVSDRHSDNAVRLAVNSCKFLDSKVHDAKGLKDYAEGLLIALNDIEPGRFSGKELSINEKLDALLADLV